MTHPAPRTAHSPESWRSHILDEFTPKVSRLTLVADPDGLLLEEGILKGIRDRGFELIPFEDHIAFRYAYESKFRARWDRGEQTELVVVLHSQASDLGSLPYDLLQAGRRLAFSLADVFPNLSYPVITALDRGDLDALYDAQTKHAPGPLSGNATKGFILRHVFGIVPELINRPSDLLHALLRRHYRNQRIPVTLDERLLQLLRQNATFHDWPLESLIGDRAVFFSFLQERWPVFLDRLMVNQGLGLQEERGAYGLSIEGPAELSFDHDDVRVYIDNLFVEGLLSPVVHKHGDAPSETWVGIGLRMDPSEDLSRRLVRLIDSLRNLLPTVDARYDDWLHFARGWAELILLSNDPDARIGEDMRHSVEDLQAQVDTRFTEWLSMRYAGLINLPPVPPVMLHHLPRFLARQIELDLNTRVALLVVDGLSLDQWLVLREVLTSHQPDFRFREQAVFAWIPSITSVSRQATFAGRPPIFFPDSIQTTAKEPALWERFWVDQGLMPNEIIYAKGLGDDNLKDVSELLSHPKTRVAGLVVDKVDRIMHGMQMGTAGMHNQVRQWAQQSYLTKLLDLLLDRDFQVFLTSDHGNIEAKGCGRPAEGAVADLRGERARTYPDPILRSKVKADFPHALEWEPVALPDGVLPLLALGRDAFVRAGERVVSHGGISVEEIIVPLVQIERRDA